MLKVNLVHWNAAEARQRAGWLESVGCIVDSQVPAVPELQRTLRQDPPDAVIIDLSRLPSQGRDLGLALRFQKATRHIPLVFVGGDPQKVDRVREKLPDAVYTTWDRIGKDLLWAVEHPPTEPVVPSSLMEGYLGQPLIKKLGIKPGMRIGLLAPPPDFAQTLGQLPEGAVLHEMTDDPCDLMIWFVHSRRELDREIEHLATRQDFRGLWIAWPKKTSGIVVDLTQVDVRAVGLAHGWVDYKICSIDDTWSGLLFSRRRG